MIWPIPKTPAVRPTSRSLWSSWPRRQSPTIAPPNCSPGFGLAYLVELQAERASLTNELKVLPGVPEVLARLNELGVCQSLLTGNLEPIARLKLACAKLDHYVDFDLGAYGSDNPD